MSQDWREQLDELACVVHTSEFQPDCEMCLDECTAIINFTGKVTTRNTATEQRIAYLGHTIDITSVVHMRLNTLIDMLVQHNPKMRARFEATFAVNCEEALRQTEENCNNLRQNNRLIVP